MLCGSFSDHCTEKSSSFNYLLLMYGIINWGASHFYNLGRCLSLGNARQVLRYCSYSNVVLVRRYFCQGPIGSRGPEGDTGKDGKKVCLAY